MRLSHITNEASHLTVQCNNCYIQIIERAPNKARPPRITSMTRSFFRNALSRMVEARERQVAPYVNGALMNLDDETLKNLGTSRAELLRKGTSRYPF